MAKRQRIEFRFRLRFFVPEQGAKKACVDSGAHQILGFAYMIFKIIMKKIIANVC